MSVEFKDWTGHSQLHGHCDPIIDLFVFKMPSWNN